MGESKIRLLILKTNNKFFVTDNVDGMSYFNSRIGHLFFDGEQLQRSFKDNWYSMSKIPTLVQTKLPRTSINHRFVLRDEISAPLLNTLPPVIVGETLDGTEYESIYGLYVRQCDYVDGGFENVEFEYELISEDNEFYLEKPKYPYSVNILTQLTTHKDLRVNRPCKINTEDLYKIVREFVKTNINPKYARITSDYDFCFTVKKLIPLSETKTYQADISRTKKQRWVTKYVNEREVTVFEMAPKAYQHYTVIQPIEGNNYQDLEKNIDDYLTKLITYINEPLVDCPHCKGRGVIMDK
jgi:hypothetical protein